MKKSLIFIIFILLITILIFPILFAEEVTSYENSNILEPKVLSNMDSYMKLANPLAIDKTEKYLAVANEKTIFVQSQADKSKYKYIDIVKNDSGTITKIIIVEDSIIALIIKGEVTHIVIANAESGETQSYQDVDYQNIYTIINKDNKFTLLNENKLISYDIDSNNTLTKASEMTLTIGVVNEKKSFKIINDNYYILSKNANNTIIKQYNFATNSFEDKQTILNTEISDYYYSSNDLYFVSQNKLYKNNTNNELKVSEENVLFNNLVFDSNLNKLYVTAQDDKVYLFDSNGSVDTKNTLTSKGNELQRFDSPQSVFSDGTYLYIADTNNKRIIKRSVDNDIRTPYQLSTMPTKVVAVANKIYYLDKDKNLYDTSSDTIIKSNVLSIAVYNNKLLVLSDNKVLTYDGKSFFDLIKNISITANDITTAVSTNYAYLIDKTNGIVAKYDLENTENAIFTTAPTDVKIGNNYNIDFRGNLYVEKNGVITKYSQNGNFTKEAEFTIDYFTTGSKIYTAVDSVNAHYYFTSEEDHLLFEIDGEKMGLIGTKNIDFDNPTEFDIIKAGIIKNNAKAYITPNNPESVRNVQKDQVFLILAKITDNNKDYYYVTAEHLAQKEYIACTDLLQLETDQSLNGQKMSALVGNVVVYKYPFKFAEKLLINNKEFVLSPNTEVTCLSKITKSDVWNWYEISFNIAGKNHTGYVYADYLAKVVPTSPAQNIIFMKTKAPKIGANIIIYEKADLNSPVLFDDIKDGIDIQIVGEFNPNSTFTKVYYNDKIGYILNENLQSNGLTPNQIIAITVTSVAIVAFIIIAILFMHKNKTAKRKIENIEPDILS